MTRRSLASLFGLPAVLAMRAPLQPVADGAVTTFDADGTAHIQRAIPVPKTISPEAQALMVSGDRWDARRHFRSGLKLFFAAAIVWTSSNATAADLYVPFEGEKTTWHGFDRYDFIMDDATGAITPMKAPEKEVTSYGIDATLKDGKRRCVVVVPKKAAPGNPWSWQGCYWNHQPQTEVELLNRGFHIAFVAPDPATRQGVGRAGTSS